MQMPTWLAIAIGFVLLIAGGVAMYSLRGVLPVAHDAPKINFSMSPDYSINDVRKVIASKSGIAARHVVPALWPIDLIVLLGFGLGFALLSTTLAPHALAAHDWPWLFAIVPLAYLFSDLAENIVQTRTLLTDPDAVTQGQVDLWQALTRIKMWLFYLAAVQTAGLLLWTGGKALRLLIAAMRV
jgi:hypothetical protein